ncbi:hypothetical protein E2C01_092219 [Portunus trituberculatus]|uniref:Uncharacterized protein n=1 Tax=Portunus trituberculatus TaxID=210409 RepID=A0A5B7JUW7_PORTR|nr:hypothetical protein [Portunus trituberculatus]
MRYRLDVFMTIVTAVTRFKLRSRKNDPKHSVSPFISPVLILTRRLKETVRHLSVFPVGSEAQYHPQGLKSGVRRSIPATIKETALWGP